MYELELELQKDENQKTKIRERRGGAKLPYVPNFK